MTTHTYGVISYMEAKGKKTLPKNKKEAVVDLLKDEPVPFRDPKVMHQVISEAECEGKDIFIVGDVHGCLDELKELLINNALLENGVIAANAMVILCGDIVTKGPQNIETVRFIKNSGILSIRGNQDDKCLIRYFKKQKSSEYAAKNTWMVGLMSEDIEYLLDLPYSISIPSISVIVVHAGMFPGIPLQEQSRFVLTYMRSIHSENGLLVPCHQGVDTRNNKGELWAKLWHGPQHVYFGHDSKANLQQWDFATGLDTGCVYGNKLTGKFVAGNREGQLVSVDAKATYWAGSIAH